jgi:polyisoprenyl-phosphate glycosyltransferase
MKISVVVPVFNGGEAIKSIYGQILKYEQSLGYTFELILIFDKGTENSRMVLKQLQKTDSSRIKVFYLKQNCGQHLATLFGFFKSTGDLILTLDDDLQHDPKDMIKLLDKQKECNFDVVYGNYPEPNQPLIRIVASRTLIKLFSGFIKSLYKDFSSFRLIKKEIAVMANSNRKSSYDFVDANIGELTKHISNVIVVNNKSINFKSNYSWTNLFRHFLMILITYSKIIRLIMVSSIIMILMSFILVIISRSTNACFINELIFNIIFFISGLLLLLGCGLLILKGKAEQRFKKVELIEYTY